VSANGRPVGTMRAQAIADQDEACRAAIAPLVAEQNAAARLVAAAMDTGLGALLARLDGAPSAGRARALRRGETPELAALADAERARRRGRAGGAP
jgi:hypothetical protein